jgi:hypothetical protein
VPTYTDLFGQTVEILVELGKTSKFLSYEESLKIIMTDSPD